MTRFTQRITRFVLAVAAPLAGCADHADRNTPSCTVSSGGAGGGASIAPTFDTVKLVIEGGGPIMTCSAAPCHGKNGMAPPGRPLELPSNDDQLLYTNLTTYVSTACGNLKLVVPCDPAQSAILKILTGPCGATPRMPYMCNGPDGNCIPDEYIAALTQWIANGAPR